MNIMCGNGRVIKGTSDTSKEVTCDVSGWSAIPTCVVQSCGKLNTFFDGDTGATVFDPIVK